MKINFRTQLFIPSIASLILMILIGIIVFLNINALLENIKSVEHTNEVIADANDLISFMVDQETGMRGFAITGEEDFLEPYDAGKLSFSLLIEQLKEKVSDNPAQVARLIDIDEHATTWDSLVATKYIEMRRSINSGETTMDKLASEFKKKLGKRNMDEIRALIAEFKGVEQDLLATRKVAEERMAKQTKSTLVIVTIIALILSSILVLVISKKIMNQLGGEPKETDDITRIIADGNLNYKVDRNIDDSRGIYRSSLVMLSSLKEMATLLTKIADGDLTEEIKPKSENDIMGHTFFNMQKNLKSQILDIIEIVSTLNSANTQLMSTIAELSSASAETSTTVSEVSTTIEEIKQTAELSTQKAKNVEEAARKSVSISQSGIKATEDSISSMQDIQQQVKLIAETIIKLSEQSQAIGNITSTVGDIAEQSNLLAVNASIEAVKAGEYGKGFGVVANEIRMLADQSKQSAKQINHILNDVQKAISSAVMATEQGGKAVEKGMEVSYTATDAISNLADSIENASHSATQIAASSNQQLVGMEQLAIAAANIKEASNQNALGTKQAEEAVESLKSIVQTLKKLTEMYKL